MSTFQDYFSLENQHIQTSWVQSSPHVFTGNTESQQSRGSFGTWDAPILSYTLNSLAENPSVPYQLPSPPISPLYDMSTAPENMASSLPSTVDFCFPTNSSTTSMPIPMAPMYVGAPMTPKSTMKTEDEGYFGKQQVFENSPPRSSNSRTPQRPSARSWRMARHAHTIIERNYRDRLNTKISELSAYLFNDSINSGIKPSKSTVISQATDRLLTLQKQNSELLAEVEALNQKIAVQKGSSKDQENQEDRPSGNDDTEADARPCV